LLADGRPSLVWKTQPGVRYRLQSTSDLSRPNWTTVSDAVATGTQQTFLDSTIVTPGARYYRVVAE